MLLASALSVTKPRTCISTLGMFLSMAGALGFGFQSTTWAPLVTFNSQEDRFLVWCFREVWVACVYAELSSGKAETLALDYCRFGLLVLQLASTFSSVSALQYNFRKTISTVTVCL